MGAPQPTPIFSTSIGSRSKPNCETRCWCRFLESLTEKISKRGTSRFVFEDARFVVKYFDKALPIDPQTIPLIFASAADPRQSRSNNADPALVELYSLIHFFRQASGPQRYGP